MNSATNLVASHEGLDKIDTKILRLLQADGWAAADSVDIKPGSDCGADRQLSGDTVGRLLVACAPNCPEAN